MKRSLIICLTALTAISLTSCLSTKEPACNSNGYVPITKVIGPKTATLAQPAVFVLSYSLGNDCTKLTNVESVPSGNSIQVNLAAASHHVADFLPVSAYESRHLLRPVSDHQ
jgi:hypothetical protein